MKQGQIYGGGTYQALSKRYKNIVIVQVSRPHVTWK